MHARKANLLRLAQVVLGGELDFEAVHVGLLDAIEWAPADDPESAESIAQQKGWVKRLAQTLAGEFAGKRPSLWWVATFIQNQTEFFLPHVPVQAPIQPEMQPADGRPKSWNVPRFVTVSDLAERLNVTVGELEWFANVRGFGAGKLGHYHQRWLRKADGSHRLIESPKQRLKAIQRAILREILEKIPAHEAAHGFCAGRSIVSFAGPHAGKAMVLKMDLRAFFPTFRFTRVQHLFLTAGYPEMVARLLAGLCVNRCGPALINELPLEERSRARLVYGKAHLPQGAPTSPALANLCAFNLDCRLSGLAKSAGASYTRYADDLIFSGEDEFARNAHRFLIYAMAIALEEGFEINTRKTRFMRPGVSQSVAGLTVNAHPNVNRKEFDQLKAILTNCARHGPESQNRNRLSNFKAHLEGRVGFVAMVNKAKGDKLKGIFEKIEWER